MRCSFFACALVLLAACGEGSDSSSAGAGDSGQSYDSGGKVDTDKGDADHDGYDDTEDCDDVLPDVNPGASEVCDGIDNNCVEGIDEGLTTPFYPDTDGDTYGAGTPVEACTQPTGFVENADDCDDTTAAAYPGAFEVCDGIDNNCLDGVDEGVTTPFYADGDADGFGAGTAMDACAAPTGYVGNADDCDDIDAAISPHAEEECNSVDDNCNGDVDEDLCTSRYEREEGVWDNFYCLDGEYTTTYTSSKFCP